MKDLIERQAAIEVIMKAAQEIEDDIHLSLTMAQGARAMAVEIERLPSAQPQYTELTPEEAASEIASRSIVSAWWWLDVMIQLKQMGYAICRKK